MTQETRSLAGRYELLAHVARGGMADVYEARDTLLDRRVAVKVLHSQYSADDAFVKRFRREAQAAANLSHPNIVGIFDWGEDDSTYFIVMELVEGRSLREVLRSEGTLLPRRAAEIASEVAAALEVAHRAGLVHRDVKPGNILLTPDGTVKVTDFGIARAWDDSSELTRTGAVIGTATYFSPEQAQGTAADSRSDVYSLGIVIYEMLTGQPPFTGETPVAIAYQHVQSAPFPPSALNDDIPRELDQISLHALSKEPDERYQTADEFRTDLLLYLQGQTPLVAAPVGATAVITQTDLPPPTVPPDEAYRTVSAEPQGSQLPFLLIAFALLMLITVGVFTLVRQLAGNTGGVALVEIPDVTGWEETAAFAELQRFGFDVVPERQTSEDIEAGFVVRTQPSAGDEAPEGSLVTIIISLGGEAFPVPEVIGLDQAEAESVLRANRFVIGEISEMPDATAAAGIVIRQDPTPGERREPQTPIDLVVSSGPPIVVMPDLAGRTEADALFQLGSLGLIPDVEREFDEEVPDGAVIETEPGAGQLAEPGAVVVVRVSQGPEPVEVPNVVGLTPDEANNILSPLGLVLSARATTVPVAPELDGTIFDQVPAPGTQVPPGTVVTVTMGEAPAEPPDE
ncbi:MAG: Stk1 family PASTA domain-containing Ser/Thr kinase [Acidimicrobiia bacterium]